MATARSRTARTSNGRSLILPEEFYLQDTASLARDLLGKRLVREFRGGRKSGIIVETEAYLGEKDPACHTWKRRKTKRNHSMYLSGGHAYVYMIYGMHYCFNVVARTADEPEAVLVRALEPEENLRFATNGPGRLCKALSITRAQDGASLLGIDAVWIEQGPQDVSVEDIVERPRIGVEYAGEAAAWPLRFYINGNRFVSRK